jgi:hypothetical protein
MKNMRFATALASTLVFGVSLAFAAGLLNLPPDYVTANHGPWKGGIYSTLDITLSDVPDGYDVTNGTYIGWCIEDNWADDPGPDYPVRLMDSTDPSSFGPPCSNYNDIPWDRVNYLLNHKQGSKWDVQLALWAVAQTDYVGRTLTPAAQVMFDEAVANGDFFIPAPGQIVAVALCADGLSGKIDPRAIQDTIIEVLVPRGGEGCTPGYWKQRHHFDSWTATGYSPDDHFGIVGGVFNVDDTWDDTLLEALKEKGGKEHAFLRHATAALLNASSPDVNYYYGVGEIHAMVEWAYATERFNRIKKRFERANEMGCPLN